jgi:alpha-L-rhamnosidase
MSVQSDCPHRERLGYGGDAHASGEAGMSIFDLSSFYEKRALDYSDAQRPNGGFTEVAPDVLMADGGLGGRSGPIGWEVFQPASLMWLYKYYGNTRAIKTHWPQTKKFVDFLMSNPPGIEGGLGDWMPVERSTPAMTGKRRANTVS